MDDDLEDFYAVALYGEDPDDVEYKRENKRDAREIRRARRPDFQERAPASHTALRLDSKPFIPRWMAAQAPSATAPAPQPTRWKPHFPRLPRASRPYNPRRNQWQEGKSSSFSYYRPGPVAPPPPAPPMPQTPAASDNPRYSHRKYSGRKPWRKHY